MRQIMVYRHWNARIQLRFRSTNSIMNFTLMFFTFSDGTIQIQRPSIWVIDMNTEQMVRRFEIPESIVQPGHGMASVTVDVDKNNCNKAFAYIPDLLTYHLYVYR